MLTDIYEVKYDPVTLLENPKGYYRNTALKSLILTDNKLLTKLDVQGSPNLTGTLDLSSCPYIRYIEARRTNISAVTLPAGGSLEYISLPAVSNFVIRNQVNLQGLVDDPEKGVKLESWSNLTSLTIENCPMLDPIEIAIIAKDSLQRVRLTGLDGSSYDTTGFAIFQILGGLDEQGNPIPQSYLSGKWKFDSLEDWERDMFISTWPELEITADKVFSEALLNINTPTEGETLDVIPPSANFQFVSAKNFDLKIDYGEEGVIGKVDMPVEARTLINVTSPT